jgi:8-oxo-dGTP pyrophosphatase MutT (NUDIX family)
VLDETAPTNAARGDTAPAAATPRYRPTSRVLVLDSQDRLLLLLLEDPKLEIPRLWITPGGGVEPGESFEAGAQRELWEETGIVAPLGPCVWSRRRPVLYDGRAYDFDERFFVVRVDSAAVTSTNVTDWERQVMTEHRWWSVEDLAQTAEVLAPRRLAELVLPIVAGTYPPAPQLLHGW